MEPEDTIALFKGHPVLDMDKDELLGVVFALGKMFKDEKERADNLQRELLSRRI